MNTKEFILAQLEDGEEHRCDDLSDQYSNIILVENSKTNKLTTFQALKTWNKRTVVNKAIDNLEKDGEIICRDFWWIKKA